MQGTHATLYQREEAQETFALDGPRLPAAHCPTQLPPLGQFLKRRFRHGSVTPGQTAVSKAKLARCLVLAPPLTHTTA